MSRFLVGSIVAIGFCVTPAWGQVSRGVTFGVGPPGGAIPGPGFRQSTPSLAAPNGAMAYRPAGFSGARAGGGGFRGGVPAGANAFRQGYGGYGGYYSLYPYSSYYGGFGGGFITGGYSPLYVVPGPGDYDYSLPPEALPFPPQAPFVGVSGEYPATLSLQFPAAASVWMDGKEVAGAAATDRSLTSPILRPGEKYTFHVRARWEMKGQTYEATKDVTLGPGARSRLLIVSGTPVTDEK